MLGPAGALGRGALIHSQCLKVDTQDTGPAYIPHTDAVNTSSETPGPPIISAILDQPPGRAAERLAPPGRLKRVLDKAHLHSQCLEFDTFTANV
jgi:hypothetical protein